MRTSSFVRLHSTSQGVVVSESSCPEEPDGDEQYAIFAHENDFYLLVWQERWLAYMGGFDRKEDAKEYQKTHFPSAAQDDLAGLKLEKSVLSFLKGEDVFINMIWRGTSLEKQVWRQLLTIAAGETRTYSQLADELELPRGARAVGNAVGKNQFFRLIPCHRVIGKNGQSGGFAWGVQRKEKLLQQEQG